jgi:ribonuclease-3
VLELVVTEYLMKKYPDDPEGTLTRRRAALVQERALAWWAGELELAKFIRLGKGEDAAGRREHPPLLADVMEALCGAMFLDGGYEAVSRVLCPWLTKIESQVHRAGWMDYKTTLQEVLQKRGYSTPVYRNECRSGPAHAPSFEVSSRVEDALLARGFGSSIKEAGQDAARRALEQMADDE